MPTGRCGHLLPVATCPLFYAARYAGIRGSEERSNSAVLQPIGGLDIFGATRQSNCSRCSGFGSVKCGWYSPSVSSIVSRRSWLTRSTAPAKLRDRGAKPREEVVESRAEISRCPLELRDL